MKRDSLTYCPYEVIYTQQEIGKNRQPTSLRIDFQQIDEIYIAIMTTK